jgi:hypothetical protein
MKQKTREVVIRVPKTWTLKRLQENATKEFYIIKTYKRARLILALLSDMAILFPAFYSYGHIITNNYFALGILACLCLFLNITIDNFLIYQCNIIIEENALDITDNLKSGSFERLSKELEEIVKKDMSEKQIDNYILYNMSMDENDYICYALVFESEDK